MSHERNNKIIVGIEYFKTKGFVCLNLFISGTTDSNWIIILVLENSFIDEGYYNTSRYGQWEPSNK